MVEIWEFQEELMKSFREVLDCVARERRFTALTEAPSLEDTAKFQRDLYSRGAVQLFAVDNGRVVGWCDIEIQAIEGFRHSGILGMGLLGEYRGQGLGRRILEQSLAQAGAKGLRRVELEVFASNLPAIKLYLGTGFQFEGRKINARFLDGRFDDIIVMGKMANVNRSSCCAFAP